MYFYYDSDLTVYHTLADAIKSQKHCWFYFHDDVYTKANWKVEPLLSLDELYRIRAQHIRDKYPYLVLCYSGGTDSTAMLETFYYNNIHIDEILVVGALSQDPTTGTDMNHNGDLYHNAFPLLNQLNFPNTKISVVDYTQWFRDGMISDFSIVKQFGDDWAKNIGAFQSIHHFFWYDLKRLIGANNEKETAVIFGADKTVVEYDSNNLPYTTFSNQSFCDYGQHYHNENYHRVNFFTSGDQTSVDIVVKQAHVLHRVEQQCKLLGKLMPDKHEILYRYRNPLTFMSEKTKLSILSPRDTFILKKRDSEIYRIYNRGIRNLKDYVPITHKHVFCSRPYYIE